MAPDVTDKERLKILLEDPILSRSSDRNQPSIPKIQRVQPYLRERTDFQKHYFPKLLSIGPIHHGKPNLELGEHYKQRWTRAYMEDLKSNEPETKAAAQELHKNIEAAAQLHNNIARDIEDFKKQWYSEDAIQEYKDKKNELVWMLFVDGCSIIHVMNNMNNTDNWETEAAEALEIKIDQLALLLQDMFLLENQLPYKLLLLLTGDEQKTKQSMQKLLRNHRMIRGTNTDNKNNDSLEGKFDNGLPPAHLLDLLHKILVWPSTSLPPQNQPGDHQHRNSNQARQLLHGLLRKLGLQARQEPTNSYKIRNIQELKAAGIRVKRSRKMSIEAVNFTPKRYWLWDSGDLELPEIIVDDFTAPTFMNLIAYEMCPDFRNNFDISSYVAFLDLLIDHQDDVKELRSAGILQNHLGNDDEVAKLFNTISTDLIANRSTYAFVRNQIEEHCNSKWNTERAKLISDHFSSPWTCVAFFAGFMLFALTVVQTAYTIKPPE